MPKLDSNGEGLLLLPDNGLGYPRTTVNFSITIYLLTPHAL